MLKTITSPTLLISKPKTLRNIERMAARAKRHKLAFRPHFKTHQSRSVGEWFRSAGVDEISVTSLRMAKECVGFGWSDVIIAMPVNPRELAAIGALSETASISVFLTDPGTAEAMKDELRSPLPYFIELNAGYGRTGVPTTDLDVIVAIIKAAGHHPCRGFYVHSGHTYDAASQEDIGQIHTELLSELSTFRTATATMFAGLSGEELIEPLEYAIGDTPACSTQENFAGITSIGPGNFVYYDLVQTGLGACTTADIAVCLAAPVVQVFPEQGKAVVHAGWVQLGKDQLADGTYGRLVRLNADGSWGAPTPNAAVVKLSQEHGTLSLPSAELEQLKPGDLVGILPVHACALVHGMRAVGEERVV